MNHTLVIADKDKIVSFLWQHCLLLISLFILTLGVALCIRSNLGSSVISSIPLAFTIAGTEGYVPPLSLGMYTNILNVLLVGAQIIVLGRQFPPLQLLQLVISLVFGVLIDLNMALTAPLECITLSDQIVTQVAGCTIMGIGVALEVRCGSVTMAGEGVPIAISRKWGIPFPKAKISLDTTLVMLAAVASIGFFGSWQWNIVGIGTLFAMIYVGLVVKFIGRRMAWFDRLLLYRPGVRRYIYGLLRFLHPDRE